MQKLADHLITNIKYQYYYSGLLKQVYHVSSSYPHTQVIYYVPLKFIFSECTYQGTNHTVGTLFPWVDFDCGWCTCMADGTGDVTCFSNSSCKGLYRSSGWGGGGGLLQNFMTGVAGRTLKTTPIHIKTKPQIHTFSYKTLKRTLFV